MVAANKVSNPFFARTKLPGFFEIIEVAQFFFEKLVKDYVLLFRPILKNSLFDYDIFVLFLIVTLDEDG